MKMRQIEIPCNNKGFTLMELTVVMLLLGILLAAVTSKMNIGPSISTSVDINITSIFVDVETAFNAYVSANNVYPTGLTDTTFVPQFMPPKVPKGFDATYGTNGIMLAQQTGQATGNNGWYIAMKTTVNGTDNIWNGIQSVASKQSSYKFFVNTSAPSLTNMSAPSGTQVVYMIWWINRY